MFQKLTLLLSCVTIFAVGACTAPSTSNQVAKNDRSSLLGFLSGTKEPVPAIDLSWNVLASPATIRAGMASTGAAGLIRGRAVLATSNHVVPRRYKVTWNGLRTSTAADPTVLTLQDKSGNRALVLHFEGDRLRVIAATEPTFPELRFSAEQNHEVTVHVNMTSRPTVDVNIMQGKTPLYTSPPIPVMDSNFRSLDEVDISVTSDVATYRISAFMVGVSG